MYQIRINISNRYSHWFYAIEGELKKQLKDVSVMVAHLGEKRSYYAFATENSNKSRVNSIIKQCITDMLSKEAKYTYFEEAVALPMLTSSERNLLLSALVEFDREEEKEIIDRSYSVSDGLCIDGVYNFLLKDLKERWNEILQLTVDNSLFLSDREIFYELIKFLFSSIKPKINKISINMDGQAYLLHALGSGERLRVAFNDEQLMCSLIEYAPLEIYFQDEIRKNGTMRKLSKLFNLKPESKDNILL